MISRKAKIVLVAVVASPFVVGGIDGLYFGSNFRQREILISYLPDANCSDADFEVLERDEGIQGWGSVVRISDSKTCLESIRQSLARSGAQLLARASMTQGLALPGHLDTEKELVAFDFESQPGAIIWTRSKT